MEAIFNWSRS